MGKEPSAWSACVGSIRRLWRYPVKSMSAEDLDHVSVSWAGLAGDRRWAFVRADSESNGFPWHTIRESPDLAGYLTRLRDPDRPDKSGVEVRSPDGDWLEVTHPSVASRLGEGVRVMRLDKGAFDAMPVSLIATQTVAAICELAGVPAEPLRFRPNFLVDATLDQPFAEDHWVGSVLQIGSAHVRIDVRDQRCVVINVDPTTGDQDKRVLKSVGKHHGAMAGVYGSVVKPGLVRIGDPVIRVT
jgi:uncharacterized protein YcbX